tara:strand:- start:62900 stop:64693 length:1794 start_codon:yes stop_codon:yes gene_type:complete
MLILKEVRWGDCFSYGDGNSLKLNENTITQLIGENGSGKSSIALILQEVLWNKNSKGIKKADIGNREFGDGHYWIELDWSFDGKEYQINLIRRSSLKVVLLEGGNDISSHTATGTFKTIEGIFGIDFKIFVQLMYQSVNDGLSFLTATDSTRKKFLIDLFSLDEYEEYHTLYKEMVQECTQNINRINGSIDSITRWIEKNKNTSEPQELIEVPEEPKDDEELWALKDRVARNKEINLRIANNNKLKELLERIEYDDKYLSMEPKETSEYTSQIGALQAETTTKQAFLNKMTKLGQRCPTCEQDIDKDLQHNLVTETQARLDTLKASEAEIRELLAEAKRENADISRNKKARAEWESILTKIDRDLDEAPQALGDLAEKITAIEKAIISKKAEYNAALKHNASAEAHNTRISIIMEQLHEQQSELSQVTSSLQQVQQDLSIAEILKKAFSNNGLVAHKLENLVKDIENLANEYLGELSDGRFTLSFTVSSDKLNVTLTDGGIEIAITALSSGELARVNTAMLLAIRRMMNSISKTQINILFLDEVINVLDEFGRDKLVEVLLNEEGLNTFLVSHGWSHPLLAKVRVTKEDGISSLQYD